MKFIKTFFKSMDVAFSIYSKIPMPRFDWASEDMKYHLCFFPWIGMVIGLLEWGWYEVAEYVGLGHLFWVTFAIALPLLVTGGFHVDGFLDTMDALHSYQDREKKLEILKDPHIGAFAVICFAMYILLAVGLVSELFLREGCLCVCFSFVISRCLSGLSVTYFPSAKKDGMLSTFAETEHKKVVGGVLLLELLLACGCLCFVFGEVILMPAMMLVAMGLTFVYYYYKSKKEFGGITGDLAGCFVTVSELMALVGTLVGSILINLL